MHRKAADKLPLPELHILLLSLFAVVFKREGYLTTFYFFNAVVANRNAVGIAANVVDYLPGFLEGLLGIRHPGLGK